MNVELIRHDPDALTLLLGTKNTRLAHDADPAAMSEEERMEHLAYMRDTIKSSWEFVDYVFKISGVSRAFTHQFVRTRTGSYAQESQRTVDVSGNGWLSLSVPEHGPNKEYNPDVPKAVQRNALYDSTCAHAFDAYSSLVNAGMPVQDARGVLPTATLTSITAKFNLRTLHEMAKLRLCVRTQGEYQDVFRAMREAVVAVHPWAAEFLEVHCVSTGTCAFPRYGKTSCPVYLPEMDRTETKEKAKIIFWQLRHVAVPVAKDGRTM